nr:class I tRNA ligase family protein [Candidatus Dependentiae bacterium]
VLASAEYEYKERKDPSIYVTFQLKESDTKRLFSHFNGTVSLVVWTTTPWTLPLNQAVLIKPHAHYVLVDLKGKLCIVGAEVADLLCNHLNVGKLLLAEFTAEHLSGLSVLHPFIDKEVPLLFDDSVGVNEGTAFVHCAPGCGPSDYEIGVKNNLEIYSPISAHGLYTELIEPKELAGMPVSEGQWWVIKKLDAVGSLLYKGTIRHSYPHCWRCHNGLIFRATPQWFFNLEHNGIRQRVLSVLEELTFIPTQGKNFLRATVESRWEWCLSRQRAWGCPIPAVLCGECDYAYLDVELIEHVARGIAQEGIEYWNNVNVKDLSTPSTCPKCKGTSFRKETDIIDVWFESGVSHYAVLRDNPDLAFPASLYLEGIDQYRAWFQSSLITSIAIEGKPCTTAFMSHGYTVDEKGQKMSKSLGNVVTPQEIIKQVGTDGLRLWVSSIGNDKDPVASSILLRNVAEVHRKIRNTCRFLLSNLYDFDREKDAVAPDAMLALDRYALTQLSELNEKIIAAYTDTLDFTTVFHVLAEYCTTDLSSFYLDIVKDRLYCDGASSHSRRSTQTALWYILDTLTRLIAPILSFTAEQVSDHYQKNKAVSIHLQPFIEPEALRDFAYGTETTTLFTQSNPSIPLQSALELSLQQKAYKTQWETLKALRSVMLKALEEKREEGLIKHSLESSLSVHIHQQKPEFNELSSLFSHIEQQGQSLEEFFKEFLIVSQFMLVDTPEGLHPSIDPGIMIRVEHASGVKCPRCWHWSETTNSFFLDKRCEAIVQNI